MIFVDQTLSRRVERAEGRVSASFADVKRAQGSTWQDFDGVTAICDGPDSPMTQTFGLGLFTPATPAQLDAIEGFFRAHGAPVLHEVSPLAGIEVQQLLIARGYLPVELSTVLVQDLSRLAAGPVSPGLTVRVSLASERARFVDTSVAGWGSEPEFAAVLRSIAESASQNRAMTHFVVEKNGAAIATGSYGAHEGVALLAGASTVPSARGLGAQALLLGARLHEAQRQGCTVAAMAATPGSASQRNAQRRGFEVAYTRTKWRQG